MLNLLIAILQLAATYGVPAVQKAIEVWSKEYGDITLDDIEKLKELIKHPDEYFPVDDATDSADKAE